MKERIKELEDQASQYASRETTDLDEWEFIFRKKFAELIVADYARKTIQGLMSDPAFVQAMDEYYENKWSHRFD